MHTSSTKLVYYGTLIGALLHVFVHVFQKIECLASNSQLSQFKEYCFTTNRIEGSSEGNKSSVNQYLQFSFCSHFYLLYIFFDSVPLALLQPLPNSLYPHSFIFSFYPYDMYRNFNQLFHIIYNYVPLSTDLSEINCIDLVSCSC